MTQQSDIVTLADQYRFMAGIGHDLPAFCASLGVDLESIAKPLQIDITSFDDFDARISLDRMCRLMEALAAVSGDDTFGLKYGQFAQPGGTGPFGLGLAAAPGFREMLNFFVRYVHVIGDIDFFNAIIESDRITIEWRYSPLITQCDQFVDFTASATVRQFQYHAGSAFNILQARLERRPPRDKSLHSQIFSRNIKFDAPRNEFVFPGSLMASVNPSANPATFRYMIQQCETISRGLRRKKDIVTMLKEDFIQNMEADDRAIGNIARRLGMSERTLQRRLAESGTSFWDVFENTRDELSTKLLTDTDLPLSEIAHKLGYSSQSAYTRFVKRSRGRTPGQIRKQD